MLVNLRPRDTALLDCVVEECDGRFGGREVEEMLEAVGVLGEAPVVENGDGEGEG